MSLGSTFLNSSSGVTPAAFYMLDFPYFDVCVDSSLSLDSPNFTHFDVKVESWLSSYSLDFNYFDVWVDSDSLYSLDFPYLVVWVSSWLSL